MDPDRRNVAVPPDASSRSRHHRQQVRRPHCRSPGDPRSQPLRRNARLHGPSSAKSRHRPLSLSADRSLGGPAARSTVQL